MAFKIKLFTKKENNAYAGQRRRSVAYAAAPQPVGKWRFLWEDSRPFKKRFSLAILVGTATPFVFILFGTYDLFTSNRNEFFFSFTEILGPLILITLACTILLTGSLLLLRGRLFNIGTSLLFAVLLAGYIQGTFLNISLGELTGDAIPWERYTSHVLINLIIWAVMMLIPFLLLYFSPKVWSFLLKFVSGTLIGVQILSIIFMAASAPPAPVRDDMYISNEGIYELADENNVVIFILDRLDNRYIEEVLQDDPQYFDRLDGFVRFTNNMSNYSQTFPSIANMLTGKHHFFDQPQEDFLRRAWTTSEFLPELRSNGFTSKLYTEPMWAYWAASDLTDAADNVEEGKLKVKTVLALKKFLSLSAFRYAPFTLKPFFLTHTAEFSQAIDVEQDPPAYLIDDFQFYDQLKQQTLTIGEEEKAFTFIHLNGPHAPYNMSETAQEIPMENASVLTQTKGSFHTVFEYLDQLKKLGKYKDSTVIITGDHGARKDDIEPLESPIVTGLFVKPGGSADTPLQYNNAPVEQDNLRATVMEAAGLDHSAYGPTYFEIDPNANHVRTLYHRLIPHDDIPSRLLEYEIRGDANDFSNWRLVNDSVTGDY